MEKKFMPADSESNKFREPFYLESKLLLCLALVSAFVPFVGLIVVAMITVKSQRAGKYLKQVNDDAAAIRAKVDADIKKIFAEAEEKIGTIISEADKKDRHYRIIIYTAISILYALSTIALPFTVLKNRFSL